MRSRLFEFICTRRGHTPVTGCKAKLTNMLRQVGAPGGWGRRLRRPQPPPSSLGARRLDPSHPSLHFPPPAPRRSETGGRGSGSAELAEVCRAIRRASRLSRSFALPAGQPPDFLCENSGTEMDERLAGPLSWQKPWAAAGLKVGVWSIFRPMGVDVSRIASTENTDLTPLPCRATETGVHARMRQNRRLFSAYFVVTLSLSAAGLSTLAGCGDGKIRTYPVTGTVLVDGQPADGAMVIFCPVEGSEEFTALSTDGSDRGRRKVSSFLHLIPEMGPPRVITK